MPVFACRRESVVNIFRRYDAGETTTIAEAHLLTVLEKLNPDLDPDVLRKLIRASNLGSEDVINYEKFVDYLLEGDVEAEHDAVDEAKPPDDPAVDDEKDGMMSDIEPDEAEKIKHRTSDVRRKSISAQSFTAEQVEDYEKPSYPKDDQAVSIIQETLTGNEHMQILMGHLRANDLADVVAAFYTQEFDKGCEIIKQGDEGTCLYILAEGTVDIFVARPGVDGAVRPDDKGAKVATFKEGALFGELALMYGAPRAATVVAAGPVRAFVLNAMDFKMLLMKSSKAQYAKYEGWLADVEILKPLNHFELSKIADMLNSELFDEGEEIIKQGDEGDAFYILEDGTAAVFIEGEEGEKQVKSYETRGDYFGEIALLTSQPRKATVRATGQGCCVCSLSREEFESVLGPIADILRDHVDDYPHYEDFLKK